MHGVFGYGGMPFSCEELRIEGCKERGLIVWGTKGFCKHVEVRDCGSSGMVSNSFCFC